MSSDATSFVGTIPAHYDQDMGPLIFADYAADTARRVAAPARRACWRPPREPAS